MSFIKLTKVEKYVLLVEERDNLAKKICEVHEKDRYRANEKDFQQYVIEDNADIVASLHSKNKQERKDSRKRFINEYDRYRRFYTYVARKQIKRERRRYKKLIFLIPKKRKKLNLLDLIIIRMGLTRLRKPSFRMCLVGERSFVGLTIGLKALAKMFETL